MLRWIPSLFAALLFASVVQAQTSTDFCIPGVSGVIACPCGNPQVPAASARGCANSSASGGAKLTSAGSSCVTLGCGADTLVFTCTGVGLPLTTVCLFLQGTAAIPAGVTFGQGVRCVGGTLKRLYVHPAVLGVAIAPSGNDSPVSTRSAALGDTIPAAATRYYQVYYRQPIVLGGCPGNSTFNVSQGLDITWR